MPNNFIDDYFSLLESYGWVLSNSTTISGDPFINFFNGKRTIGIGFNENVLYIMGIIN